MVRSINEEVRKELYDNPKTTWLERIVYADRLFTDFLKCGIHALYNIEDHAWMSLNPIISNYGFKEDATFSVEQIKPPLNINLPPRLKTEYDVFAAKKTHTYLDYARTLAKIVNESMEYEFSMQIARHNIEGTALDVEYYKNAERSYKPPTDATLRGICTDSGYLIRSLIWQHRPQLPTWYTGAQIRDTELNSRRTHDVTILFNDKNWILINSLSPANPTYVLTIDQIRGKTISHDSLILEKKKFTLDENDGVSDKGI